MGCDALAVGGGGGVAAGAAFIVGQDLHYDYTSLLPVGDVEKATLHLDSKETTVKQDEKQPSSLWGVFSSFSETVGNAPSNVRDKLTEQEDEIRFTMEALKLLNPYYAYKSCIEPGKNHHMTQNSWFEKLHLL